VSTTKVLDNVIIIASIEYIKCVNILEKCNSCYHFVTSKVVYEEYIAKNANADIDTFNKFITIQKMDENKQYDELLDYLKNRYNNLHEGELSSFLILLLEYTLKGKDCYYITDDQTAKKVFLNLHNDKLFIKKLGTSFNKVKITGLVGLIIHMHDKGLLAEGYSKKIKNDLKSSAYYISEDLLSMLETI
jgi:predicted nucleic acid-binding protein